MQAETEIPSLLRQLGPSPLMVEVGVLRATNITRLATIFPDARFIGVDNYQPYVDMVSGPGLGYSVSARMASANMRIAKDRIAATAPERIELRIANSLDAARDFEPGTVDLVFLDRHMQPGHVSEDVRAWLPALRSGGILCGHEANVPAILDEAAAVLAELVPGAVVSVVDREVWWVKV